MIKRLRRRFVSIVMGVVTLILMAIFITILLTTQRINTNMSTRILYQALNMRPVRFDVAPPPFGNRPPPPSGPNLNPNQNPNLNQNLSRSPNFNPNPNPNLRSPVLVMTMAEDGTVKVVTNQLYFISDAEIEPIASQVMSRNQGLSVLQDHKLRCLQVDTDNGTEIACTDISVEQQMLRTLITNSMLIGGAAFLVFLILSVILARWAVHPIQITWEQQEQFVANASHELKTPLTVILTNAELLSSDIAATDTKNARRIEHIQVEAGRMKQLIEAMLTLAKLDSARQKNFTKVDVSYIVKSAVLRYEAIVYTAGKQMLYEIEDDLYVQGDAPQLNQVVEILLDNACKYSATNSTISVSLNKAEHMVALLKVSNNGDPIPQDELDSVFLRFYRRDQARSMHGSFGLGLSIAQSIVTEHKGKIWAESDGQSTNHFCVTLPLV